MSKRRFTAADVEAHNARLKGAIQQPVSDNAVLPVKAVNPAKKNKYNAKKVVYEGIKFDSQKECQRYVELKGMEQAGVIQQLQLQVPFRLCACKYVADFVYIQNGERIVEDVKSPATAKLPVFRLKKAMMRELYGIIIKETGIPPKTSKKKRL